MKWYEYLFKPVAVVYRGVSYVLGSAFNFVGDTFKGGSRIVTGASVAVSDICGDAANVTNGIGNAVNTVGSNVNKYIWAGVAVAALAILAPAFASASRTSEPSGSSAPSKSPSRDTHADSIPQQTALAIPETRRDLEESTSRSPTSTDVSSSVIEI